MSGHAQDSFGTWLRREMTSRGYDVDSPRGGGRSTFAAEAGIAISIITRILADERRPEIDTLRKIGSALGYSLAQMMVNAGLADADDMNQPIPPGVIDETHWWLGRQLVARRIALDPDYAPRAAFVQEAGAHDLDEETIARVENGRQDVDGVLAAHLDGAYRLAAGSVTGFLEHGTPLVPIDVRNVTGSAYMAATSGAMVAAQAGDVVMLDLRTPPEDVPQEVKELWNNYEIERRIIYHLPIPLYEREYLVDHLTAVREAIKRARAQQRGGNGDSQAS